MYLTLFIFFASLCVLVWSSDLLVSSSVAIARRFNMSTMAIGMTIVAIGTSLPELAASAVAAYRGFSDITLGNVVGSNICNIGLIIGLSAVFSSISVRRKVVERECIVMVVVTLFYWGWAEYALTFSRMLGAIFVFVFFTFLYWATRTGTNKDNEDLELKEVENQGNAIIFLKCVVSLVLLLLSSEYLVTSVVAIAESLHVSQAVIAISLVAFGTSVPELSVSISAAKQKQGDILIGNILGSNITNILLVIGASALIKPINVSRNLLMFDFPIMAIFGFLLFAFLISSGGITRIRGIVLLSIYSFGILRLLFFP